ncbi:MAG: GxxExxY protein [Kiritimatiellae bacterium]|nr:GxxExxY protein [Kiritimatiellia bacterium]
MKINFYRVLLGFFENWDKLNNEHKGQLLNYLRITGLSLGLLINFRSYPVVEILRLVN